MKNALFLIVSFFMAATLTAQQRQTLYGRVISESDNTGVPNVFVINSALGDEVKTNSTGNFSIQAQPGDQLVVYSPGINSRKFNISEESFKKPPYVLSVEIKSTELKEVVIEDTINEVSLGIVPADQKHYTVAERRLFNASNGIDGLINVITGRKKMMEKALENEKKEDLMKKIDYMCTEEEIINDYKIPAENVRGFIYFVADDKEFTAAMKDKNTTLAKFIMQRLAQDYLKRLNNEE